MSMTESRRAGADDPHGARRPGAGPAGAGPRPGPRHGSADDLFRDGPRRRWRRSRLDEMQGARAGRFAAADTDGDGVLTRDELVAGAMARAEAGIDRLLERADSDGDGALSAAELDAMRGGRRAAAGGPRADVPACRRRWRRPRDRGRVRRRHGPRHGAARRRSRRAARPRLLAWLRCAPAVRNPDPAPPLSAPPRERYPTTCPAIRPNMPRSPTGR